MNIYEKMLAITEELGVVAKNLDVNLGKGSYKAVGEADVLKAVKPLEVKYKVYSFPFKREIVKQDEVRATKTYNGQTSESVQQLLRLEVTYRFVNIEKSDEYIDIISYGDGLDTGDKATGKAMTYADKYALLKAYKIQTGDDPDQEASPDKIEKKAQPLVTKEQLEELKTLGIDIAKVATYCKKSVDRLTQEEVEKILIKKRVK